MKTATISAIGPACQHCRESASPSCIRTTASTTLYFRPVASSSSAVCDLLWLLACSASRIFSPYSPFSLSSWNKFVAYVASLINSPLRQPPLALYSSLRSVQLWPASRASSPSTVDSDVCSDAMFDCTAWPFSRQRLAGPSSSAVARSSAVRTHRVQ